MTTRSTGASAWKRRVGALIACLAFAAAACGGGGSDGGTAGGAGGGSDDAPTLGVLAAAVEEEYALDIGVPDDQLSRFDTTADMVDALRVGRIDAFALTAVTVNEQVEGDDEIEATEGFVPVIDGEEQLGCGGYVFRFEDKELRDAFNETLTEMKENDEILPLIEEFGFDESNVDTADGVTVEDLAEQPYDAAIEEEPAGGSLERARSEGVRIGIADERPYGFQDPETGEPNGQAPTVAAEVLERLDIEIVDSTVVDFQALINGLNADQYDLIAAGMFINEERASQALFTDPDYCGTTAFAVPAGNPMDISRFEDFVPESS